MKNQGSTILDLENIRRALTAQDENLQQLARMIAAISGNLTEEFQSRLSERLRQIEAVERMIWSATELCGCDEFAVEHRMTMSFPPPFEQYY